MVAMGAGAAGIAYFFNGYVLATWEIDFTAYTRYVSPFVEELLKGLVIVALIRTHRVGFLVDAAIFGFAVGAGFALVENVAYLEQFPGAPMGTWIVRGFGTAIMHGGGTAIFAMVGLTMIDRHGRAGLRAFLPGFAIAAVLHSAFNHFFLSPKLSTLGVAIVMPVLLYVVFERSEKALAQWLGTGFRSEERRVGKECRSRWSPDH